MVAASVATMTVFSPVSAALAVGVTSTVAVAVGRRHPRSSPRNVIAARRVRLFSSCLARACRSCLRANSDTSLVTIYPARADYNRLFSSVLMSRRHLHNGLTSGPFPSISYPFPSTRAPASLLRHFLLCTSILVLSQYRCSRVCGLYASGRSTFERRFKALVYMYLRWCVKTKDRHLGLLGFPESSLVSLLGRSLWLPKCDAFTLWTITLPSRLT